MAEDLIIDHNATRENRYEQLIPQLSSLVSGESSWIANLGNIMAGIKESMGFLWVGVYLVENSELVLGPFQGPVACTRIAKGKGVCGTSWLEDRILIIPDVEVFPGHIACSSASKSEIVLPIKDENGEIIGILDVDSIYPNDFSAIDQKYLSQISELIESCLVNANK